MDLSKNFEDEKDNDRIYCNKAKGTWGMIHGFGCNEWLSQKVPFQSLGVLCHCPSTFQNIIIHIFAHILDRDISCFISDAMM